MRLSPVTVLLLAAAWGAAAPARAAPPEIGVASSLVKLRPHDPAPAATAIDLVAARGECEAAQIAVRASDRLEALGADAKALGPGAIPVALYRVATIVLGLASGPDGAAGEWPDPLVPARDAYFGEERRAFPVAVEPGRLQAIWVEVCVPEGAAPGVHTGSVRLSDGERRLADLRVRLRVWPFALPRTGAFAAAFG